MAFVKGEGQKIAIQFTENLSGDVTGLVPDPLALVWITPWRIAVSSVYSTSTTYQALNLIDGRTSSYWRPATTSNEWILIELDSPRIVKKFRWYISSSNRPQNFVVYGSKNGLSFSEIYSGTSPATTGWLEFEFENEEEYLYYRINILTVHSGNIQVYEIQIEIPQGNELAFTVTGQEYNHVPGGILVPATYEVDHVKRIASVAESVDIDLTEGIFDGLEVS